MWDKYFHSELSQAFSFPVESMLQLALGKENCSSKNGVLVPKDKGPSGSDSQRARITSEESTYPIKSRNSGALLRSDSDNLKSCFGIMILKLMLYKT